MSETKQKVVLISASPKVDQDWAVSAFLANRGDAYLKNASVSAEVVQVRSSLMHHKTQEAFEIVQAADAIVLVFPLYFFCMPAMLTRFLQDFAGAYPTADKESRVYAIINCGFPESGINMEAMRVVECFARQTGRLFLGGVMIGGGGMLIGAKDAPFMRPTFELVDALFVRVARDTLSETPEHGQITESSPKFPRWLYILGGHAGWHSMARKNHIKPKEIRRKPYLR